MKKLTVALSLSFVLCALLSFINFSNNCEDISEKVIRFHIPANSDSKEDQEIKLKVKDKVFLYVTELLKDSGSYEESKLILNENIKNIENYAESVTESMNVTYGAKAELRKSYFKTREYENFTLPAGEYLSLYIKLGDGAGQNWWCALYPSLCIPEASDFSLFTEEETEMITNQEENKVTFLIYEWFLEIKKFFTYQ